ncbi:MAG: HNH endonuclease signature motif containing protein, partial [Gemmatimonadota bacterium]|nr:HNH endonuclease signature motif containing protein [Gemmatimonadota bacterium]
EPGRSELADGTRVSAETSRRLACDAGLVRVERGAEGSVLDVGRKTRTVPTPLRRALEIRDRGCRFPGCGYRFTDGHHIKHWADGGETSLANTVLLCGHHHRLVHEGGWTMIRLADARRPNGRVAFQDPRGQVHYDAGWRPGAPPGGGMVRGGMVRGGVGAGAMGRGAMGAGAKASGTRAPGSVEELIAGNRRRGVDPDADAPRARWKWESLIPEDVLERAREALL